ncbi:MDR family MFS transporter [Methylocapsa sp. S129]|uniref:MDR family MFS transporter n=1 Tax=Methylocapsa sp. S129 TaxID=1641869 RepID=UPI00131DB541|nr:MDR family MFS transporter [Methylocapsa sp. S129]
MAAAQPDTYQDLSPRAVLATVIGVMIAMLMAALDQTIVGTAMPRIISELHGFEHYSAVVTAYMIASTAILPIAGKLSDVYGRKPFLLVGVLWFMATSALCGFAGDMLQLVIFRALQGLGAGVMQTMAFTTIADLYPPAKRGRVIGIAASVFGLSSVIGPLIGGFLTDGPGWRYAFYVNLPVGFVALAILYFFFPHIRAQKAADFRIDYAGSLSLVASIVPVLLALSWGGRDYAWASPTILGLLLTGVVFGALFFVVELRAAHPIVNLALFRNAIVSVALSTAFLTSAAMFGAVLFIPLFVQSVLGSSATDSGKILMPLTLALLLTAVVAGQGISRTGRYRPFAIGGAAMGAIGMFLLSRMDPSTSYFMVVRNVAILGVGLGAAMPVFNLAVQNAVEARVVGSATSMVQFVRSIGGTLGVAAFGSVLASGFAPAFRRALPADIVADVSPQPIAALTDAQLYMTSAGAKQLEAILNGFGLNTDAMIDAVRQAARIALAGSLRDVFEIAAALLLAATALALFLREIPLRKTNQRAAEPIADNGAELHGA